MLSTVLSPVSTLLRSMTLRAMSTSTLPHSSIPIFTTVSSYREWRRKALDEKKSVGFVPTMGALHEGHLSLVRRSLQDNDLTVLSIFVNPAQFAPHEDLATYPRTLEHDLRLLAEQKFVLSESVTRTPSAVFLPTVKEMYPAGISQDVASQRGTFVEVKGYGDQMEGKSRPSFFRGVATVVTKLFNAVEPTNAYFGQKDIQQALLLRRLVTDLLLSHPAPNNLHIVPTARDVSSDHNDNLALSSRNTYLSPSGRKVAGTLYAALRKAEEAWDAGRTKHECLQAAQELVLSRSEQAMKEGLEVKIKLDYIEMNTSTNFEVVPDDLTKNSKVMEEEAGVILSGAMWVDKTRLIDNILLGDVNKIIQ